MHGVGFLKNLIVPPSNNDVYADLEYDDGRIKVMRGSCVINSKTIFPQKQFGNFETVSES